MTLRVADLFCGGGGISEGLRQAGLEIVYAADKDRAAALTFDKNHPNARVDVADVSLFDPGELPEFDVLVGGPPCIEFSASKGSRGNILEGLRLVQAFLRVVHERKPKYWIMENVPRIVLHLPEDIPLRWIGVDEDGFLHVPVRAEFNCAEYGVPQARKRFLMGDYPMPEKTSYDPATDALLGQAEGRTPWRSLGEVISAFPDPMTDEESRFRVADPNYDVEVSHEDFTDHFHTVALNARETRSIRRAKESHPYMGFMPFPDRREAPARTVVATQLGRETLVLTSSVKGETVFRRATIRECASLQTFPVEYQFFGNSLGARYRIVGDAVPPRLSFLIGQEILKQVQVGDVSSEPIRQSPPPEKSPSVIEKPRKRADSPMNWNRKFSELVPGKEVRGCRVELDNQGGDYRDAGGAYVGESHLAEWTTHVYVGEGRKNLRTETFSFRDAIELLAPACLERSVFVHFEKILSRAAEDLPVVLRDATTMQAVWTNRSSAGHGPEDVVDQLSAIVDEVLPRSRYSDTFINTSRDGEFLPKKGLRIRLAAGLAITAYACEIINGRNDWAMKNPDKRFIAEGWTKGDRRKSHPKPIPDPSALLSEAVERQIGIPTVQSKTA